MNISFSEMFEFLCGFPCLTTMPTHNNIQHSSLLSFDEYFVHDKSSIELRISFFELIFLCKLSIWKLYKWKLLRNFQFVQNGKDSNIHELNNATGPSVQAYEYGRNMIAKYNCKKIRLIQMIVDAVRSCF